MSKDQLVVDLKKRLSGHSEVFVAGAAKGYRMAIEDIENVTKKHENT